MWIKDGLLTWVRGGETVPKGEEVVSSGDMQSPGPIQRAWAQPKRPWA